MKRRYWTVDEIAYLKQKYADTATHELAAKLNRSLSSVYGQADICNLNKSEAFRNSPLSGRLRPGAKIGGGTRFNKGHATWNKGKKMPKGWCSPAMQKTQFKKGDLPHNVAKEGDGAIRIRRWKHDGYDYQYIRVSLGRWIQLHQHVWVQVNGSIPPGHIVVFKDRNTMNCDISNLEMITLKENMQRNTIHRYPADLKKAIRTMSKLKRTINKYEKQDH